MFGRKKEQQVNNLIGAGTEILGTCCFRGTLEIAGTVIGDVLADPAEPAARLVLHEGARVEGGITARDIVIAGAVFGPVTASGKLELLPSAQVEGDVRYLSMDMAPGARVNGKFQPQIAPPAAEPAQPARDPSRIPTEPTLETGPLSSD